MFREYNLKNLNIENPLSLQGNLNILKGIKGFPIVFLIDENHNNLNDNINKNIENAKVLIESANVKIVGVESHSGGYEWDQYDEHYTQNFDCGNVNKDPVNGCSNFVSKLVGQYNIDIYGVESFGMLGKMQNDLVDAGNYYYQLAADEHPLNIQRSKHFIKTLFDFYVKSKKSGNLILNCGKNHHSHIEGWIESGEIDLITNFQANYIRINTID